MCVIKTFIILFFLNQIINYNEGASAFKCDSEYICPFDAEFLKEIRIWRSLDMYVLSPELNPAFTYKVEISETGIFFRRVLLAREADSAVSLSTSKLTAIDFGVEHGGLKLKASNQDTGSSSSYYKARNYIEFECLRLTSKSDLFCVISNPGSIVCAFRVLFSPEPRPLDTARLTASTVTIKGKISGDLSPSELYIHGVRWVQLAINPATVYKFLRRKFVTEAKD
jgi:hypothetical protein